MMPDKEKETTEGIETKQDNLDSQDKKEMETDLTSLWNAAEERKTTVETKEQTNALLDEIKYEDNRLVSYELLDNNDILKQRLLNVLSDEKFNDTQKYPEFLNINDPEKRVEIIFRKINIVICRFYERKFNIDKNGKLPKYVINTVVPATEWYLMNILKESWQETNVGFLDNITWMNIESISWLFESVNSFSSKYKGIFKEWRALLNIADFLSLPKNEQILKKIKNPYELYDKVFKNSIWRDNTFITEGQTKEWVKKLGEISFEQFWLSDLDTTFSEEQKQTTLETFKNKIKWEIWNIQMVENTATVEKLLGVLRKADKTLWTTKKMWDAILDGIDMFWSMSQSINHAFGFDARKVLKKIEKGPLGGILTFILSLLGFWWGIWGIEKAWKKRKIDNELDDEKRDFIESTYSYYMQHKDTSDNLLSKIKSDYDVDIKNELKNKLSVDTWVIQSQINEKIGDNLSIINPQTLNSIKIKIDGINFKWSDYVVKTKDSNWKSILTIDTTKFTQENQQLFTKAYIKTMLQYYNNKKHAENLKDADTLAFTIISWVTLNKDNTIDGVEAEVLLPSQFYEASTTWNEQREGNNEVKDNGDLTTTLCDMILSWESSHNYWAVNRNDNWSVSIGLIQRHKERATNVLKKLKEKDEATFNSIMVDPLFKDLDKAWNSVWTENQANQFNTLMKNEKFKEVQDQQMREDVNKYIKEIHSRGVTDKRAICALWRMYNAAPSLAKRVFERVKNAWKDFNNYNTLIAEYNEDENYGKKHKELFERTLPWWDKTLAQRIWEYNPEDGLQYTA